MICNDRKFIYVHIPKCAGTLIEKHIISNDFPNIKFSGRKDWINVLPKEVRMRYCIGGNKSLQHKKFCEYDFEGSYKSYAIIRNPWSKCVSEYFYAKKVFPKQRKIYKSFKGWLIAGCPNRWPYHNVPQFKFTEGMDENNIFKMESQLEEFNEVFFNDVGLPKIKKLEKTNSTNHGEYTDYYDEESIKLVAKKYAKDIEYFGYEFGK